jgi:ribonuclease HI
MFVYGEMDVPQVDHYASGLRETLGDELRRRGMILLGAKDDVLFAEDPFGMRRMYSARLWDCSLDDPFDDLVSGSRLLAWCDGSGVPTDKVVGAGAVVKAADGSVSVERSWSCGPGTNNVAEITGISLALATCSRMDLPIKLYADSKYALGVVSNPSWTPKANLKLVKEAQALAMFRSVRFEHVRGHAGNEGNERADKLAGMARVR